jgi:hypothetical protein
VLLLAVIAAVAALAWPRDAGPRRLRPGGFLIDANGRPQPLRAISAGDAGTLLGLVVPPC